MKLTILGSGTCNSNSSVQEDRFAPAYILETEKGNIMFDCGEGAKYQMTKIGHKLEDIHHLCISHPHADHFAVMQLLQSIYCKGLFCGTRSQNQELNIYTTGHIVENFMTLWNIHFPELEGNGQYDFPDVKLHTMENGDVQNIVGGKLEAHKVHHGFGKCPALAFKYTHDNRTFSYTGDMGYTKDAVEFFKGTDVLLSEASTPVGQLHDKENPYGHLTPQEAGKIAKEAGVKKLILTHYPGVNSDDELVKDCKSSGFKGEIVIAKDLMQVNV